MSGLRFALMHDGDSLEQWQLKCLEHLANETELAGTITTGQAATKAASHGSLLMGYYGRRAARPRISAAISRLGQVSGYTWERDAERIRRAKFDFILKFGAGPIPPGVASLARLGLWFFPHEMADGTLPFFLEVYHSKFVTEAFLLALRPSTDQAVILQEGHFATDRLSYIRSRDRILAKVAEWPAAVCHREQLPGEHHFRRQTNSQIGGAHGPSFFTFCARMAVRRLAFVWERLFQHRQWNVGVLRAPAADVLTGRVSDSFIDWFPLNDRRTFLADPFAIRRDGMLHIFFEHFEYAVGKGRIRTMHYSEKSGFSLPADALDLPVHMSYPFLVEENGQVYCVPEISDADEVPLFRATEFPGKWAKVAVLLDSFAGVDPTVFRYDGRWWLFCTRKGPYADVELWAWYATDLLGPWTAHAGNPIKTDIRGTRPGGAPFMHEGVLYRPAQDCSKAYGGRIVIQKVERLTPFEFDEQTVATLEPAPASPFPEGRHTFTPVGDVVIVDGHRIVFAWSSFQAFLRICARDFAKALRRRLRVSTGSAPAQ